MRDRAVVLAIAAGLLALAAVATDVTPLLRGPAPYPPEWRWDLRAGPASGRLLPALLCGAGLVALLAWAGRGRAPRAAVAAAVPLGLAFQLALLALEPDGALRTLVQRTVSRTVTSYYTVALSPMAEDARAFLARHDELLVEMRHGAKHASTHPPGPVLFFRGLAGWMDAHPLAAQRILDGAGLADPERRPGARAAALLGPLLILLLCAATAWPVATLARAAGLADDAAAGAGVLWLLLPGPALMAPQFDQALALPVTLAAAALGAAASAERARARVLWSGLAGLAAAVAAFFSYGAAAFVAIAGAAALAAVAVRAGRRRCVLAAGLSIAAAALATLLPVALGYRPWRSAAVALEMHRATFTAPRRYALWLLFNPVDLAWFAGVPIAVLFAVRLDEALRRRGPREALDRFTLAAGAGLLALVVSGTVRGEVGRIWIPLMPLLLVPAAARLGGRPRWHAPAVGALLVLLCLALRLRWQVG